ncbi:hypothetical protein, partial [Nonomuraea africana]|uniref:hypothetical protein n=1 Tax=Nonomuraea africana TaxID=46171 RepID=UPI0033C032B1
HEVIAVAAEQAVISATGSMSARAEDVAVHAVTALTGRQVVGWDRDAWSRSIYSDSSWYACLAD